MNEPQGWRKGFGTWPATPIPWLAKKRLSRAQVLGLQDMSARFAESSSPRRVCVMSETDPGQRIDDRRRI